VTASMINQCAPHQLRRDTEKVSAVLPADPAPVDQSEVYLIDRPREMRFPAPSSGLAKQPDFGRDSISDLGRAKFPQPATSVSDRATGE
jgi:hypothetical protein